MTLRRLLLVLAPLTLACVGPFGTEPDIVSVPPSPGVDPAFDSGRDSPVDTDHDPEDALTVDQAPDGDVTCFDGSLDALDLDLDESTFTLTVVDVLGDEGLEGVEVALSGSAPGTSDDDGKLPVWSLQTCRVLTAESTGVDIVPTTTSFVLADGGATANLAVVTTQTLQIVPALLGLVIDDTRGHVWGQVFDCSGQPLDHVEVRLGDAIPRYMRNSFPDREQEWTSDDGGFLLTNAPPGPGTVTAWIWRGDEYVAIAAADLTVDAGTVHLVQLGVGVDGHGFAPSSCD